MPSSRRLQVDIVADAKGVAKGTRQAERQFSRLGGFAVKAAAGAAAGGVAAIGAAAAGMAVASVKAASDLEQSMGAVETVFGKSAAAVERYARDSSTRLGLARSEYQTLAVGVGTSFRNMGKSQAESAKLSDVLVTRAADLAATYGGTTSDAVERLGSAFRGEFDSIEKLGFSIKASDISARLAAQGQSKLTGQALKAAQGQATYALLMEQSADKAGAFAREGDTLAHQQQVLRAQFENVKAALGARLIPVLVRVAQWFQEKVLPAARQLGGELQRRLAPIVAQVGQWVSTRLVPALKSLGGFVTGTIIPVFKGVLVPTLAGLWTELKNVAGSLSRNSSQFAKLKPVVEGAGKVLKWLAPIVGKVFGKSFEVAGTQISTVVGLVGGLIGVIDTVIRKFDDLWNKVTEVARTIGDKVGAIGNVVGKIPGLSLDVTTMRPGPLAGPAGRLGPSLGQLATAAAADPLAYSLGAGAGRTRLAGPPGGATVNMPITVNGALDPVAVARQLERVLRDAAVRLGRQPAYGW